MGTLLTLAIVSMLLCGAHAEKRPEVCISDVKMAGAVLSAVSSQKPLIRSPVRQSYECMPQKGVCKNAVGICSINIK